MANVASSKPAQFCLQVTKSLDRIPAAPMNVKASTNVLDTIMSAENKAGWSEIDRVSLPGKPAPNGTTEGGSKIYLEYEKPYCDGGTSADVSICDTLTGAVTEQKGWLAVDINKYAERHFVITKEQFANFCESPDDWIPGMMRRKAHEIKREINKEIIQELYAINNAYTDGTASVGATAKELTVISQDGNIIPAGFARINKEYRKAHYRGKLYTFGGETFATYLDVKGLQGMSMNSVGANVDPFANMPFTYDSDFDTEFQTLEDDENSHGFTLPVGSLSMQEWYDHEGYGMETNHPEITRVKMTIDGMTFDYSMKYDPCGGTSKTGAWTIMLKKKYGLGSIPASVYCNSQGLNFHWLLSCGDFSCATL